MPIEFRCTKCSKLLRTPDDTAGKQARCPECGTIVAIPAAAPSSPPIAAPLAAPAPAPYYSPEQARASATNPNPYQSSLTGGLAAAPPPATGAGYGKLQVGDTLSRAWKIFVANMGSCIGIVVLYWVLYIGSAIVFGICIFAGAMVFGLAGAARGGGGNGAIPVAIVVVGVIGYLIFLIVQVYFILGQLNFFLKVSRGDFDADVSKIFTGGRWVLPAVGGGFLVAICISLASAVLLVPSIFLGGGIVAGIYIFLASVLLLVPGVILGLMFSQFLYLIVDRNLGVIEAFGESRRITTGNKGMLFLTLLLPILGIWAMLIIPGVVLPMLMPDLRILFTVLQLILQLLFAQFVTPWLSVLWAVCYLIMSGQTTSDRGRQSSMPASATGVGTAV